MPTIVAPEMTLRFCHPPYSVPYRTIGYRVPNARHEPHAQAGKTRQCMSARRKGGASLRRGAPAGLAEGPTVGVRVEHKVKPNALASVHKPRHLINTATTVGTRKIKANIGSSSPAE